MNAVLILVNLLLAEEHFSAMRRTNDEDPCPVQTSSTSYGYLKATVLTNSRFQDEIPIFSQLWAPLTLVIAPSESEYFSAT